MTPRQQLREFVIERSRGGCEWTSCVNRGEQLAHIEGIGMGGRPSADTEDNVWFLCVFHHDLFDGRSHAGLRRELVRLVKEVMAKRG